MLQTNDTTQFFSSSIRKKKKRPYLDKLSNLSVHICYFSQNTAAIEHFSCNLYDICNIIVNYITISAHSDAGFRSFLRCSFRCGMVYSLRYVIYLSAVKTLICQNYTKEDI